MINFEEANRVLDALVEGGYLTVVTHECGTKEYTKTEKFLEYEQALADEQ